jgi:hypothetical protein
VKPQQRPSRHLVYFALVDALAKAGCPVCTLGLRAVERYLGGLAYEQVNDPGVRAVLRAAHGFCTRHAWQFADLPHAHLGTAIIYRDIAATLLRGLTRRPLLPWAGPSAAGQADALAPRRPCPACAVLGEATATALRAVIDYLDGDDPELQRRYPASGGLCRPHLTAALPLARQPRTREILVATAATAPDAAAGPPLATAMWVELLAGKEGAVSTVAAKRQGRGRTAARQKRPCVALIARPAAPPDAATVRQDAPPVDGGCLACAGALAAADGFLRGLAAEVAEARRPGAEPVTLCNRHAWRLVRVAPRAVEEALTVLRSAALPADRGAGVAEPYWAVWRFAPWRRTAPHGWADGACPACRVEAAAARRALAGVEATARAKGVPWCVPHTLLAVRAVPRGLAPQLLTAQAVYLARLVADLERAIRKHDYRFRDEPWEAAYDAPRRAVAHIAGARGLALRER